jgi:hypothetical protein
VVERSGKAECRESGTLRLAWEVGVVMLKHDPYQSDGQDSRQAKCLWLVQANLLSEPS